MTSSGYFLLEVISLCSEKKERVWTRKLHQILTKVMACLAMRLGRCNRRHAHAHARVFAHFCLLCPLVETLLPQALCARNLKTNRMMAPQNEMTRMMGATGLGWRTTLTEHEGVDLFFFILLPLHDKFGSENWRQNLVEWHRPRSAFFFAIMISAGLWGWGGKSRRGADSDEWPEEEGPSATDKSCWSLG